MRIVHTCYFHAIFSMSDKSVFVLCVCVFQLMLLIMLHLSLHFEFDGNDSWGGDASGDVILHMRVKLNDSHNQNALSQASDGHLPNSRTSNICMHAYLRGVKNTMMTTIAAATIVAYIHTKKCSPQIRKKNNDLSQFDNNNSHTIFAYFSHFFAFYCHAVVNLFIHFFLSSSYYYCFFFRFILNRILFQYIICVCVCVFFPAWYDRMVLLHTLLNSVSPCF